MSRKTYKQKKKGAGRFVQLPHWILATEAWSSLKPGPRALYIELKRRYTGSNNGRIRLSHREAATALSVTRNTVGAYFEALIEHGFIHMTQAAHLGPSGIGLTSEWALEEYPTDDLKPARMTFVRWREKQNPRPKNGTPRHDIRDTSCGSGVDSSGTVPNFGT
ncbi:hypothetical protein [Defluviimonas salinarum]|uniref:Helix-turn-helix domain-containing protein n=1 Tax=Defluviimonas salinarum TaxID=2992147 RepID=A0ABT3J117_9RHOB|nr:hypothetical protein [Defluviimonas salinarum]MCW3781382.1 hypothetical protein [Defluviimonas salinarum]